MMVTIKSIIYRLLIFIMPFVVTTVSAEVPELYRVEELTGAKGPSDLLVKTIYRDSNNLIWLGTGNSVERFDGNNYVRYSFRNTPLYKEDNSVTSIVCTGNHDYWAGNKFGVWKLNHLTYQLEPVLRHSIQIPVKKLMTDTEGNLYIGTENGLYIAGKQLIGSGKDLNGTNIELAHLWLSKGVDSTDNRVVDMDVQSPEKIWWITETGVVFCNPKSEIFSTYNCPEIEKYGAFTCCLRIGGQALYRY